MTKNDVASFFYYMWNAWCKVECEIVFVENAKHFWDKWAGICSYLGTSSGATERFFAELSGHNQDLLVKRATELYAGRTSKI